MTIPQNADRAALRRWLLDRRSPTIHLNWQNYLPRRRRLFTDLLNDWEVFWTPRWKTRILQLPYRLAKPKLVDLNRVASTNETLCADTLLWLLDNDPLDEPAPWLASYCSRYYIVDGHHRLWLTQMLGQREAVVRVFPFNYYLRAYPITQTENLNNGYDNEIDIAFDVCPASGF